MYGAVFQPMVIGVNRVSHVFRGRQGRESLLLNLFDIHARFVGNPTVAPSTRRQWPPNWIRDSPWLGYSVDLGRTSKKSFGVCQSQRASTIRSLPCHQVRSESETQLTLVKQVKSARVTIRQTHPADAASMFILSMSLISKAFAPDSIFGRDSPLIPVA